MMELPQALQERVSVLYTKSAESLKKAGAYTIISVPRWQIIHSQRQFIKQAEMKEL